MDFDEDDLALSQDSRTSNRPTTGGGQRPNTASRPISRRGSAVGTGGTRPFSRQGSAVGGRPLGSAMAGGRLGSAMHRTTVPGTASRLQASAMQNRPLTSKGGIGLQTPVQVADRPITQQGLSGIRTAATGTSSGRGPQRQFQDKSYFMGVLRSKMSELTAEISNMRGQIASATEEQSTFLAYDKRVKETASELTSLQAQLADYNLLVDKLNTDTEVILVQQEAQEMVSQNESDSREVESLFAEKQERMANIQRLEQELEQEGHMADNLVSAMKPKLRDRYVELKNQNTEFQMALEKMNQELDTLNSRKTMLEDEVAISALKREALSLYENLRDLEQRRDELSDEVSNRGTPAEERERLLAQVKDDNAEIAIMEQQIGDLNDHISRLHDEGNQLDQDLEENQSENNVKYRDLRKREETMDKFLHSFEDSKREELERCSELQRKIEELSSAMSVALDTVGSSNLPSRTDFASMKEDLAFREGEVAKSKQTLESLRSEHTQLKINLEKIENLEDKIKTEMETLKGKIVNLDDELRVVSDLDKLRADAAEKKRLLEAEHLSLGTRKTASLQNANSVQDRHNQLLRNLADNETAAQLTNLEKKLSHLEQNNFAISEFIANKKAETSFEPVKNRVLKLQQVYNQLLIENIKNKASAHY